MQPRLHPRSRETIQFLRHRENGHPCRSTFRSSRVRQPVLPDSSKYLHRAPSGLLSHQPNLITFYRRQVSLQHRARSSQQDLTPLGTLPHGTAPTFFHRCDSTDFLKTRSNESEDVCLSHGYRERTAQDHFVNGICFRLLQLMNRRNHACGVDPHPRATDTGLHVIKRLSITSAPVHNASSNMRAYSNSVLFGGCDVIGGAFQVESPRRLGASGGRSFSPEQIVIAYAAPRRELLAAQQRRSGACVEPRPPDRERGRALRLEPIRPTRSTPTESNPKFAYP